MKVPIGRTHGSSSGSRPAGCTLDRLRFPVRLATVVARGVSPWSDTVGHAQCTACVDRGGSTSSLRAAALQGGHQPRRALCRLPLQSPPAAILPTRNFEADSACGRPGVVVLETPVEGAVDALPVSGRCPIQSTRTGPAAPLDRLLLDDRPHEELDHVEQLPHRRSLDGRIRRPRRTLALVELVLDDRELPW